MIHLDNYAGPEPSPRISETLVRRSGKNAMGFPLYRIVRSEAVFEKVGGLWHEWDADLNIADRGGIETDQMTGLPMESHHRPDRVIAEVRQTQVYSHFDEHGWVLERWYPASFFGSPMAWNANVVPKTDIPLLGPYPSHGRYLALVGPLPKEPSMTFIEEYIANWETRRDSFPSDVEEHIRMRVDAAVKREEAKSEHAMRENQMRLTDSVSPLTSTSLEAGRWRGRMFERAGFTSHIGN